MRMLIRIFLILAFGAPIAAASAEETTIPGFATLTYPNVVKLKKTGCQEVPFQYVTDENLPRENTVFFVAITPFNSKRPFGYAAWFSTQTYKRTNALPPMARIGTLKLKVCRNSFMYSSNATKKTPGIKPGTYQLYFNASYVDAQTGELVGEKIEIPKIIKFN